MGSSSLKGQHGSVMNKTDNKDVHHSMLKLYFEKFSGLLNRDAKWEFMHRTPWWVPSGKPRCTVCALQGRSFPRLSCACGTPTTG